MVKTWQLPSDEEFERQHAEAIARGLAEREAGPTAMAARYDAATGRILIELADGCMFGFPAHLGQGLRGAASEDLAEIVISPSGAGLRWPRLDADLLIAPLMAGVFGSARWMESIGRKGGRARSTAKAASSRMNGAKGGRPRKTTANS